MQTAPRQITHARTATAPNRARHIDGGSIAKFTGHAAVRHLHRSAIEASWRPPPASAMKHRAVDGTQSRIGGASSAAATEAEIKPHRNHEGNCRNGGISASIEKPRAALLVCLERPLIGVGASARRRVESVDERQASICGVRRGAQADCRLTMGASWRERPRIKYRHASISAGEACIAIAPVRRVHQRTPASTP